MSGPTSGQQYYRPELDILRSFAFLMVFAHHAFGSADNLGIRLVAQLCGTGLQIFFFLSSFLIMELLLRELEQTGTVHIQAFYARRMLRIWPLYFSFLTFAFLLAHVAHFGTFSVGALSSFVLLSGNWWVHFHGWLPNIAAPLWSISLEEQFYLAWPVLVRFNHRKSVASICLLLIVVGLSFAIVTGNQPPIERYSFWSNSFIEFMFFAAGSLTALGMHNRSSNIAWWTRVLIFGSGLISLTMAGLYFHLTADTLLRPYDLPAGCFLLMIAVTLIFRSIIGVQISQLFSPFVKLGKLSFGMYVFHYGALSVVIKVLFHAHLGQVNTFKGSLVVAMTSLILTLLLALASYRLLERPFLRLKRHFTFVATRIM